MRTSNENSHLAACAPMTPTIDPSQFEVKPVPVAAVDAFDIVPVHFVPDWQAFLQKNALQPPSMVLPPIFDVIQAAPLSPVREHNVCTTSGPMPASAASDVEVPLRRWRAPWAHNCVPTKPMVRSQVRQCLVHYMSLMSRDRRACEAAIIEVWS